MPTNVYNIFATWKSLKFFLCPVLLETTVKLIYYISAGKISLFFTIGELEDLKRQKIHQKVVCWQ